MRRDHRLAAANDALVLLVATGLSGLLSYLFVGIGTRAVGPAAFAPVGVLWTLWALTSAVVTFPVQHWIIRTVAADGDEAGVAAQRRPILLAVVGSTVAWAVVLVAVRDLLFGQDGLAFALMAGLLPLGSLLVGVSRGLLAARSRFGAVAAGILGENAIRVVVALAVVGLADPRWFGVALLAGFAVVACWPRALVVADAARVGPSTARSGSMGDLAGGMLGSQVVLTAGTLVVPLVGGTAAEVTTLFAGLALVRGPYMLMVGVATRLTRPLTNLVTTGRLHDLRRLETVLVVASLVGAVFAWLAGPWAFGVVIPLVFGAGIDLPTVAAGSLAVGAVLALASLVQTVVLLARDRTTLIRWAWGAAVVVGAVAIAATTGDPVVDVSVGFVAAEVTAWLVLVVVGGRPARHVDGEAGGQGGGVVDEVSRQ